MRAATADDLVTDILDRIATKVGIVPKAVQRQLEKEIRNDWGGETHYVAKHGESARGELEQRDASIRNDHRRGERVELLSRRYGLTTRRINQIIKKGNGLP